MASIFEGYPAAESSGEKKTELIANIKFTKMHFPKLIAAESSGSKIFPSLLKTYCKLIENLLFLSRAFNSRFFFPETYCNIKFGLFFFQKLIAVCVWDPVVKNCFVWDPIVKNCFVWDPVVKNCFVSE